MVQEGANKLMVMSDDAEMGNFGTMTTLTHHNWCPEMLAAVRRGPLAKPTEDELIEHLSLIRHKGSQLIISSAASMVATPLPMRAPTQPARPKLEAATCSTASSTSLCSAAFLVLCHLGLAGGVPPPDS